MRRTGLWLAALGLSILASLSMPTPSLAVDDTPSSKETADQRFERLLAESMKAPEKADWKSLRVAFAETSRYQPYSIEVTEKLKEISRSIGRGETKESEAALLTLLEREGAMKFETSTMLMMLYEKTDQPEKAEKSKKILEGILGVLDYPKAGTSFEDPIHVLFIQEEYLVTTNMPIVGRGTAVHDKHRFDVFEIGADGEKPAHKIYFNIDLLHKALSKSLEKPK